MKHPKKIKIAAIAISVALSLGVTVLAASYDSSEDPLISLSYITNIFKPEITQAYEERIAELEERIVQLEGGTTVTPPPTIDETETTAPVTDPVVTPAATYEVIELTTGDSLYAISACDIMLRAGSAICIAPDSTQGIADYTDATEIYNGQALVKNHMCLIPRGDGRGIAATSGSVFIMIRGDYTIVKG